MALIECIPNFSEGQNAEVIEAIAASIRSVEGVKLLHIDPGHSANRTVMTFAGEVEPVVEAAYQAVKTASSLIDMRKHTGTHPRMGAVDVCPLVPISGISTEELIPYAETLAKRIAEELGIPIYLYEENARDEDRKNLARIRAGEYEGFRDKIKLPGWEPDFGPAQFNAKSGQTVLGVRKFLVAYNINLKTKSVKKANAIAFDIREIGRVKKVKGKIQRDEEGKALRIPGMCKSLKAIGWFIEEYKFAQVSTNLTDLSQCAIHEAYEAAKLSAEKRKIKIRGSELIGLIPKEALLTAGKFYAEKLGKHMTEEREFLLYAVKQLGLDDLGPFNIEERVLEYVWEKS
ncbi:MAG: glutamate formimidoyltransferase [Bacteroidia bacterium]|nr:glutamate formimidoyltransferase [Bacteroidia bacterium]